MLQEKNKERMKKTMGEEKVLARITQQKDVRNVQKEFWAINEPICRSLRRGEDVVG
jgi:hypothetical protein